MYVYADKYEQPSGYDHLLSISNISFQGKNVSSYNHEKYRYCIFACNSMGGVSILIGKAYWCKQAEYTYFLCSLYLLSLAIRPK